MSRTFRRTHLNRQKRRVFRLYWMYFSKHEIENSTYVTPQQYHADNYAGKHIRGIKKAYVSLRNRELRQDARLQLIRYQRGEIEDVIIEANPASIKWDIT